MVTVFGEMSTRPEFAVDSVTTTSCGAVADSVTGNAADFPIPTEALEGSEIDPHIATVTERLALLTFGAVVLAVIVVVPVVPAVT